MKKNVTFEEIAMLVRKVFNIGIEDAELENTQKALLFNTKSAEYTPTAILTFKSGEEEKQYIFQPLSMIVSELLEETSYLEAVDFTKEYACSGLSCKFSDKKLIAFELELLERSKPCRCAETASLLIDAYLRYKGDYELYQEWLHKKEVSLISVYGYAYWGTCSLNMQKSDEKWAGIFVNPCSSVVHPLSGNEIIGFNAISEPGMYKVNAGAEDIMFIFDGKLFSKR